MHALFHTLLFHVQFLNKSISPMAMLRYWLLIFNNTPKSWEQWEGWRGIVLKKTIKYTINDGIAFTVSLGIQF